MGKEDSILEEEGRVIDTLSNATFRVQLLETNHQVTAHLSGKMRINRIRIAIGDLVKLQISIHNLKIGRIVSRKREHNAFKPPSDKK